MKTIAWILVGLLFVPAAAFAQGGRLLAVLGGAGGTGDDVGALIEVEPSTGSFQVIGTPIPGTALTGLGVNSNGDVWATTGSDPQVGKLIQIDPATGALLDSVGMTGPSGTVKIQDLAIQPGTDTIYGIVADGGGYVENELVTIDPVTGEATSVSGGSIGSSSFVEIAFAPDGTLYALFDHDDELRTLDPSDGSTISTIAVSPSTFAMGFGGVHDGIAYVASCCNLYGYIYTIDLSTGAITFQSSLSGTRAIHDFALLPATPVPVGGPWALGLLLVVLAAAGSVIIFRRFGVSGARSWL